MKDDVIELKAKVAQLEAELKIWKDKYKEIIGQYEKQWRPSTLPYEKYRQWNTVYCGGVE